MGPVEGLDGGEECLDRGAQGLIPIVGSPQIENIQPFSAKDLSIRSLGDRIRDLAQLKNLYPKKPKDEAFRSHYKRELGLAVLNLSSAHLFYTAPPPTHCMSSPTHLSVFGALFVLLAHQLCPLFPHPFLPSPGALHGSPFLPTTAEQMGKDGRGYVPATIKMTVER